jgi:hypothetical protein
VRRPWLVLAPALAASAAVALFLLARGFASGLLGSLALSAWLFVRVFVLSVDQAIYWVLIVCGAIFVLLARISQAWQAREQAEEPESGPGPGSRARPRRVEEWRSLLADMTKSPLDAHLTRQDLLDLLVQAHALETRVGANYLVAEAYKRREIPMPEELHAFLFVEEKGKRKIARERVGRRDKAKYRRAVEICLDYLESFSRGDKR